MTSLFDSLPESQETIRSVYWTNSEILAAIIRLHCPEGFDCDATYGNGSFYKEIPRPKKCFDVTPLHSHVERACSTCLPIDDASIGSLVFDPPFLTYVRNGRQHQDGKVAMAARFGGYYRYSDLEAHYLGTIKEARRVLKVGGKLVFKCQDIIHNHRMHCTHARVIAMAEANGFQIVDLFILPAKSRMPGPQKGTQRHARVFHSYFVVFERRK